jgi:hypothetical protein
MAGPTSVWKGTPHAVEKTHASTKFGWDAALGPGWGLGGGSALLLEAHTSIDTSNENLTYIPVVFGVMS